MKKLFFKGVRDGIPIFLGYLSVSFGFGILCINLGLSVATAVGISITNLTSAGQVAGVSMTASACIDGKEIIYMDHPQQIEPEQVGVQTGDYVIIKGTPDVNMVNSPEIEGGKGTIAMCANMIPQVINAEPGLHTMLTLPVPRAILGDMRDRIDPAKKLVK